MTELSENLEIRNFHNVTLDDLKLILAQAEKKLDDSIKNIDATTTKTISFISLSTAILVAQTAYFFTSFDQSGTFDPKLFAVFLSSVYTFIIVMCLVHIVLPQNYFPIGTTPDELFKNEFFTDEFKQNELSTKYLYLCEIESYTRRIKHNFTVNSARLSRLRKSIKAICLLPVVVLTIYFVTIGLILASLF
jgi:hypothetical protein